MHFYLAQSSTPRSVRLRGVEIFREILCKNELFSKNILACLSEISRQTPSPWHCRAEIVTVCPVTALTFACSVLKQPHIKQELCPLCPETQTASH